MASKFTITQVLLQNSKLGVFLSAPDRPLSLATRGLGAFLGIVTEDGAETLCKAVSTPRTRTLRELVGPPAAPFLCRSEQARRTIVSKVVSPPPSCSCCERPFHLPQQPGCCRVERSKVTPEYETPLGPGHAFRLTVHVNVSSERRGVFNRLRVDKTWLSPPPQAPAGCGPIVC